MAIEKNFAQAAIKHRCGQFHPTFALLNWFLYSSAGLEKKTVKRGKNINL